MTSNNVYLDFINSYIGLEDGKVRALNTKTNKSQNLYETQSMVVSLAANERGTGFICGHDDGSIIRYYISEESGAQVSGRIVQHQTTPIALAWANGYIVAAGCDRRIFFYDSQVRNKFGQSGNNIGLFMFS